MRSHSECHEARCKQPRFNDSETGIVGVRKTPDPERVKLLQPGVATPGNGMSLDWFGGIFAWYAQHSLQK